MLLLAVSLKIAHNGLALGAVAVFGALTCRLATILLISRNLEFITFPAISYIRCACCTTPSSNIAKGLHKIEKFINFMPMQGKKNYQEKLFTSFKLSDRVSKENFYRRLKEVLNLDFL